MTVVPTERHGGATTVEGGTDDVEHLERASVAAPTPLPWWRPLARWKAHGRRVLPGVSFPIVVFAVWRVASALALMAANGRVLETAGAKVTVK